MYSEVFFHEAAKAIRKIGTYSQRDNSWTIGISHLRMIFENLLKSEPQETLPSYIRILKEGEQRGFWQVNYDHEFVRDLVVIRLSVTDGVSPQS